MTGDDWEVIIGLIICILAIPLAIEYWFKWLKDVFRW